MRESFSVPPRSPIPLAVCPADAAIMRWSVSLASLLASGSGALAALAPRTSMAAGTCWVCPESAYGNIGTSYVNADNGDLMCPMTDSTQLNAIACEYDGVRALPSPLTTVSFVSHLQSQATGALVAGSNADCPAGPAVTSVVLCNPLFGEYPLYTSYYQSGDLFCEYQLPVDCSWNLVGRRHWPLSCPISFRSSLNFPPPLASRRGWPRGPT